MIRNKKKEVGIIGDLFRLKTELISWLFDFCVLRRYTSPKMSMVGRRRVKENYTGRCTLNSESSTSHINGCHHSKHVPISLFQTERFPNFDSRK